MNKNQPDANRMRVIGLMSGTSLDGIDCADVEITRDSDGRDALKLLGFHFKPYHRRFARIYSNWLRVKQVVRDELH